MMLIGAGQGGALGPLTASGIARVPPDKAGAASGVVNVAHQLGSSLGLGALVAFSVVGTDGLSGTTLLAHRAAMALEAGTVFIAITLLLVLAFIMRGPPRSAAISARTA
jgi:sugar phosphate permease